MGTLLTALATVIVGIGGNFVSAKVAAKARAALIGNIISTILVILGILSLVTGGAYGITQFAMKPTYTVITDTYYSAGNESDWSYGNQRKEFSVNKDCYFRLDTLMDSDNRRGNKKDVELTITFTGTDICDISQYEGNSYSSVSKDKNKITYNFTIKTKRKSTKADINTFIFKYEPKKSGEVTVNISYDDNIAPNEDKMNKIVFVDNPTSNN